jgi:uncharacterized membrane protein YwaF
MSATGPVLAHESGVLLLARARQERRHRRSRSIAMVIAVLALCLLGLIGSFADSAVARTSLLLVDPPYPGSVDNVAATLVWAMIANVAVCIGVVIVIYWLLSWPSAQIVILRSERPSSKP